MTIDEFRKVDLRIGKILSAERVPDSEKLIKLMVDLSEKDENDADKPRQILAGVGKAYEPEALVGREIVVVANLDPRMFVLRQAQDELLEEKPKKVELESQGMLLAANDAEGNPVLLALEHEVPPGARIQ